MTQSEQAANARQKTRIVFMGSPEFSAPTLKALHEAFEVCAVYTQPPRKSGRGMKTRPTAIGELATHIGLPCFWPERLRGNIEEIERLKAFKADIFVVIAYGLILPQSVLDIPPLGCINGHASLLPRWRGAAPIQRAIEAGDRQTGISIMQMEAGLDTGPVLMEQAIELATNVQAGQLHDRLTGLTAEMMIEAVNALTSGQAILTPQKEEGVTYAHKITNAETCLSFDMPAEILARKISAFSPFPAASVETISGRLKLLAAIHLEGEKHQSAPGHFLGRGTNEGIKIACADQSILEITRLKPAGKQTMSGHAFLNGQGWQTGISIEKAGR